MQKRQYDPETRRRRYQEHKERDKARMNQYYQEHKAEQKAYQADYYREHREEIIKRSIENRKKRKKPWSGKLDAKTSTFTKLHIGHQKS